MPKLRKVKAHYFLKLLKLQKRKYLFSIFGLQAEILTINAFDQSFHLVEIRDDKGLYFRRAESLYRTAALGDSFIVLPLSLIFTKCHRMT